MRRFILFLVVFLFGVATGYLLQSKPSKKPVASVNLSIGDHVVLSAHGPQVPSQSHKLKVVKIIGNESFGDSENKTEWYLTLGSGDDTHAVVFNP